jgi:hypothetical protein
MCRQLHVAVLEQSLQGNTMTPTTTVIAGPVVAPFDGDVARIVKLPNGSPRIEWWRPGLGWVEAPDGAFSPADFMPGACRPVSPCDRARLGIPASEL